MNVIPTLFSVQPASTRALLGLHRAGADFGSLFNAAMTSTSSFSAAEVNPLFAVPVTGKLPGLSATGRNTELFDPESAYRMMTAINQKEVIYKAQYASLQGMRESMADMSALGHTLADLSVASGATAVRVALQDFADAYNRWSQKFGDQAAEGGLLADTSAAKISRRALEQSIGNMFLGAQDGLHGLKDLGITLSSVTHRVSFDSNRFDATFNTAPVGAMATVREFGANFSQAASLLVSADNFIPRQIDNLNRVIGYIADHHTALQTEFGTGDPPKVTGVLAQALAAYTASYGA
jgi:hypothetical protein